MQPLDRARELIELNRYGDAYLVLDKILEENPNHPESLIILTALLVHQEKYIAAYQVGMRAAELQPTNASVWINLSTVCHRLWRINQAELSYKAGMKTAGGNEDAKRMLMLNRAAMLVDMGQYDEAEKLCEYVIAQFPNNRKALENLGHIQLATGRWKDGWVNYDRTLDPRRNALKQFRRRKNYGVPDWKGERSRVVIYGEQGIGDIIAFASIVPDAISTARSVVLDVEPRLVGLFARSFPQAEVVSGYEGDCDHCCAIGQLGGLFRSNGEFPGTPYLVPDPIRVGMWQDYLKGEAIGIAWSGGLPRTAARFRKWTAEDMEPLMKYRLVSLQYKGDTIDDIEEYRWATKSYDYDDTAALVAALPHVICVQTAVGHLSAALGVPTTMFVAQNYVQWRDLRPWCDSMRVIRQARPWRDELEAFAKEGLPCRLPMHLRQAY